MADVTGSQVKNTYKDLLHISNSNAGADATLRTVETANGNTTPLQLSTGYVNINGVGKLKINGTTITATGVEINYLSGVTSNIQTQLDTKAAISYVNSQDSSVLSSAQSYADSALSTHIAAADPHTGYILADGSRAFTGAQTIASGGLNTASSTFTCSSGVTDGASALGYDFDTANKLDTVGAVSHRFATGNADIFNVIYEAGTGLFGSPSIVLDFNGEGNFGRITRFRAGGILGSYQFEDYTGSTGVGIFPTSQAFSSRAAGTAGDEALINFAWGNGAHYWAGFYNNGTIKAFSPDNATMSLGDNRSGDSPDYKWYAMYMKDSGMLYFGDGVDASISWNGTNLVYDSTLVSSGKHDFTGDVTINNGITMAGAITHTGSTVGFFSSSPVTKPTALTASATDTVDSTYSTEEATVINNLRTRLDELESKLQSLGLLA